MKKPIECPYTGEGQRDLAPLYLAGMLGEEDAEAFEAHYFGCAKCREDVRAGASLRELYGKPAVAASARPAPARPTRAWLPLAAAAVIAFVALGVWQLTRRPPRVEPTPLVVRGAGEVLGLEIESGQGGIDVSWPPHPSAATYEIEVLASNGASVWKTETPEPRVHIVPWVAAAPGQTYEIRVGALDSLGQVIASGEASLVPKR